MKDNIKLSIVMNLLDKEIANVNEKITQNSTIELENKLNYLLNLKNSIYLGSLDGIDEFLEKYKEDKL